MSQISKQALIVDNNQSFPTNNAGDITPADLRGFNVNMIDSSVNEIPYQSFTASVTNSINLLNAFTQSQQPQFSSLNAFTASQLSINTGLNAATYSLNSSVSALQSQTSQLTAFTGSINQIQSAGVTKGYATRFNFSGLMTASITANVNGNIADISLLTDTTKVSTSSFNVYTASTDSSISNLNAFTASQITFNNSATSSISQLLSFSSSLDATYATDAQLAAVSSSLNNNINTKLSTSSFNSYSQSVNQSLGGYATTGSNTFYGSQTTISDVFIKDGQLYVSSSTFPDVIIESQLFISSSASGSTTNAKLTISGSASSTLGGTRASQVVINPTSITITRGGLTNAMNTTGIGTNASSSAAQWSSQGASSQLIIAGKSGISYDNEFAVLADSTGVALQDWDNTAGTYSPWMTLSPNDGVTIPKPQFTRGLISSGSVTITGSAYGNVIAATIASSTASIDLSKANYFTLTLNASPTTSINIINPQPGVTATLVINTAGAAATFSSNVKQPSGSFYVPSVSGNIDILSLTAVTTSSVYVVPAYTFV